MVDLPAVKVKKYREQTFHLLPGKRLNSLDEAVAFVQERGFVFFWPISGITFPNLWAAVAGDRPVADAHDDPGHVTWGWKDSSLGKNQWYYAKILRKKATMVAMNIAPYFYALSENYGAPDEDYLTQYEQGRMTQEAKVVYETLLDEGPLDTIALRRATRMSSPASESRFNRAISDLQADFKILPVAVTQAGAWHYAFAYDVVFRHYPDIPEQAHPISESQARQKLAELYFLSLGVAQVNDLVKLFRWTLKEASKTIDSLEKAGLVRQGVKLENKPGEWVALKEICPSE